MFIELNLQWVIIFDDDMFDVNGVNEGDGSWCEVKKGSFLLSVRECGKQQ